MHKDKAREKEEIGNEEHRNECEDDSHDLVNRIEKVINNPVSSINIGDEKFLETAKKDMGIEQS